MSPAPSTIPRGFRWHWRREVAGLFVGGLWSLNFERVWIFCPGEHPPELSKGLQQMAVQAEQTASIGRWLPGYPGRESSVGFHYCLQPAQTSPGHACHVAQGAGLGSPEELGASCANSRICGHALSRGDCVPRARGTPGASRPSSHRQPWSTITFLTRLFPELQTTGHHCPT